MCACAQQPNLRPGLQTVLQLAGAVEAVQKWRFPGMGGSAEARGHQMYPATVSVPCKVLAWTGLYGTAAVSACLHACKLALWVHVVAAGGQWGLVSLKSGCWRKGFAALRVLASGARGQHLLQILHLQDDAGDEAEASEHKKRAGEERRQAMRESEEQLQQYAPRIPGTVLLVYRRVPCRPPSRVHCRQCAPLQAARQ